MVPWKKNLDYGDVRERRISYSRGRMSTVSVLRTNEIDTRSPENNAITTAKYSMLTFLPKNLFEQFRRVANFYFLVMLLLQSIPVLQAWPATISAVPVIFVVGVTAAKDLYEDIKRHRSDKQLNNQLCTVIRNGTTEQIRWRDVTAGQVVRLRADDDVPADLVLLSSSDELGRAHIETRNLDGETSLKQRDCPPIFPAGFSPQTLETLSFEVTTEAPSADLYRFNGTLRVGEGAAAQSCALDLAHFIPRGSRLRNTTSAFGVVIYAGQSTKIMLNAAATPSKRTRIEKIMNQQIIVIFGLQLLLAALTTVMFTYWHYRLESTGDGGSIPFVDLYPGGQSIAVQAITNFFTLLIITQNLVPIALYASVEIVKVTQAFFINQDLALYHEKTNMRCVPRSWNLSDNLGQITYIFSDKTGTLTMNEMEFRQLSAGGRVYGTTGMLAEGFATVAPLAASASRDLAYDTDTETMVLRERAVPQPVAASAPASSWRMVIDEIKADFPNPAVFAYVDDKFTFSDKSMGDCLRRAALLEALPTPEQLAAMPPTAERDSVYLRYFLEAIMVCHSVVIDAARASGGQEGTLAYDANSPDEAALVMAAKNFGYVFLERDRSTVLVLRNGERLRYEIMAEIPFSSERRRMSVLVRAPDGSVTLYCKGADSTILGRLAAANDQGIVATTTGQVSGFATSGLRTLCIAGRSCTPEFVARWTAAHKRASEQIEDREAALERVAAEIETDFILLGATGVEDRLQPGVPETINSLKQAGVGIWMLTGDKLETSINIASSCNLVSVRDTRIVVTGTDTGELIRQLDDAVESSSGSAQAALFVEGPSLAVILKSKASADVLFLVRRLNFSDGLLLAIGDGANDVAMIQQADVGVGISGYEGRQAVLASDYAIARFRYLKRLLLVHGRFSYVRCAQMALNFFYKNFVYVVPLVLFQTYAGQSSQMVYHYSYQMLYNLVFTSLPAIAVAIFDKDVSDDMCETHPELYKVGIDGKLFNSMRFWTYVIDGTWQGIYCLSMPIAMLAESPYTIGTGLSLYELGFIVASCVILCANLTVAMEIKAWNPLIHTTVWGSILSFYIYHIVAAWLIPPSLDTFFYDLHGLLGILTQPSYYLIVAITVLLALGPRFVINYARSLSSPSDALLMRETAVKRQRAAAARQGPRERRNDTTIAEPLLSSSRADGMDE